jgi:N-acetyl-anhydromuramyl-L-alanine amidase AmpD
MGIFYTSYPASPNNYTEAYRPYSNSLNKIIIHVTQGSWSGAINWFQNPNSRVSAHYVVRSSDGFIQTSIGIEHEGFVSDPKWFTEPMYDSSAKLSAYICKAYAIPIDRSHIIGHVEIPGTNHTDPGVYWDWAKYMNYIWYYARII